MLYVVFFAGRVSANPLTIILVIAVHADSGGRVAEQALVGMLSRDARGRRRHRRAGRAASRTPSFRTRRAPAAAAAGRAAGSRDAAAWIALQATLVVMPVFVLALTNPAFYLAAIMKTVALGQQAGETDARSAGASWSAPR